MAERTNAVASFRNDRLGSTAAIKRTIQSFVDSGMLIEIPKPDLIKKFQFTGVAYGIGSGWVIE
jgi:hypothetical protein